MFKKASKRVHILTVVSPETLSPTPSISSGVNSIFLYTCSHAVNMALLKQTTIPECLYYNAVLPTNTFACNKYIPDITQSCLP